MPILNLEDGAANPRAVQVRIATATPARTGTQRAHDLRMGPQPGYVDGGRTHLNRVLIPPLTGAQLRPICEDRRKQRETKRRMRRDAAVSMSGIVTFGHLAQATFLDLPPEAQDAAYREVADAVASRLGTTLTSLVVHADESAPHAHFQLIGYDEHGAPLSAVAKRGVLRDVQTLAAEVMARHAPGIERGFSKIDRLNAGAAPADVVNRSVAELHDVLSLPGRIAMMRDELEKLETAAEAARDRAQKNERLADRARQKVEGDEARAGKATKRAETYERRAADARQTLDGLTSEIVRLETRRSALEAQSAARRAEIAQEQARAQERASEAQEAAQSAQRGLEAVEDRAELAEMKRVSAERRLADMRPDLDRLDAIMAQKKRGSRACTRDCRAGVPRSGHGMALGGRSRHEASHTRHDREDRQGTPGRLPGALPPAHRRSKPPRP